MNCRGREKREESGLVIQISGARSGLWNLRHFKTFNTPLAWGRGVARPIVRLMPCPPRVTFRHSSVRLPVVTSCRRRFLALDYFRAFIKPVIYDAVRRARESQPAGWTTARSRTTAGREAPRGTSYRRFRSRSPRESFGHLKGPPIASRAFE